MAAIGTALMGRVLGHSEAEKAFRPWSVTQGAVSHREGTHIYISLRERTRRALSDKEGTNSTVNHNKRTHRAVSHKEGNHRAEGELKHRPIWHKPWPIQTIANFQDSWKSHDSCRL